MREKAVDRAACMENLQADSPCLGWSLRCAEEVLVFRDYVLDLWVQGVPVDWAALYGPGDDVRRISLPAYPFAKERYWPDEALAAPAGARAAPAHPLLHENESNAFGLALASVGFLS